MGSCASPRASAPELRGMFVIAPAANRASALAHAGDRTGKPRQESGFALIETLVAVVLMSFTFVVAMNEVDAATRAAENGKARSAAAALAVDDQERMRRAGDLDLEQLLADSGTKRKIKVDFKTYEITSIADYVSDAGGTDTCLASSDGSKTADYVRIKSEVQVLKSTNGPVKLTSYFTPKTGAFEPSKAGLTVLVKDAAGVAVASLPITIDASGVVITEVTNSLGCALFSPIPAGPVTASGPTSRVNVNGKDDPPTAVYDLTPRVADIETFLLDLPASTTATFDTRTGPSGPVTAVSAATPGVTSLVGPTVMSHISMTAAPYAGYRFFPSGSPAKLFPFTGGYGIWGGTCVEGRPDVPPNTGTLETVTPPPGGSATPTGALRLPTMIVHVQDSSGIALAGAEVQVRPTGTRCSPAAAWVDLKGTTSDATPINPAGELGSPLPFGSYDICVRTSTGKYAGAIAVDNTGPNGAITIIVPTATSTCPSSDPLLWDSVTGPSTGYDF